MEMPSEIQASLRISRRRIQDSFHNICCSFTTASCALVDEETIMADATDAPKAKKWPGLLPAIGFTQRSPSL
jgi:hypothetical protein